jgi:hypothetical protein
MSGVAIIRELLANWAPLTALVPAGRIYAGQVPQGSVLPAISVSEISVREHQTIARLAQGKTSTARIQVTVLTKDYPAMKAALKAAGLGPGVHTGTVKGYSVKAALPDGIGPEIPPIEDGIFEQSRDFLVTFSEPN